MKDIRQVIADLNKERLDLSEKIRNLETFISSPDFQEIELIQRRWLTQQHTTMNSYKNILIQRIEYLQRKRQREALAEKNSNKAPAESAPEGHATMQPPANQIQCAACTNYLGNGICTGDKEHHQVDTTGELKCFDPLRAFLEAEKKINSKPYVNGPTANTNGLGNEISQPRKNNATDAK